MADLTEKEIQSSIMLMLSRHPKIAWAYVTSTGTFKGYSGGRPISIGIPGLPDICGQLKDGRFLGIEVKKPGKTPTEKQIEFIKLITKNKGLSFWCDSVDGAMDTLDLYA